MSSVNKVILVGNVGADPEIRTLQNGSKIANIRLATSETWKDKQSGEKKEKTEWHRIVVFNEGLAKVVENYVRKGSKIYVEGQLQTRKWTDQSGAEKYSTEVVLQAFNGTIVLLNKVDADGGGQRNDDRGYSGGYDNNRSGGGQQNQQSQNRENFDLDDEIPF